MSRQERIDFSGALQHVIVRGIEGTFIFKEEYDKKVSQAAARMLKKRDKIYFKKVM